MPDDFFRVCLEANMLTLVDRQCLHSCLAAFRRAGVLIGVDDVGFGRSSLESLVVLEPDVIKIDKRCVQGIAHDSSRARSLKRMLKVTEDLGTDVVADGIEAPDDLHALKELGVRYGQGFLLGVPVAPRASVLAYQAGSSASIR